MVNFRKKVFLLCLYQFFQLNQVPVGYKKEHFKWQTIKILEIQNKSCPLSQRTFKDLEAFGVNVMQCECRGVER